MRIIRDITAALGIPRKPAPKATPAPKPKAETPSERADRSIREIIAGYKKACRTGNFPKVY